MHAACLFRSYNPKRRGLGNGNIWKRNKGIYENERDDLVKLYE